MIRIAIDTPDQETTYWDLEQGLYTVGSGSECNLLVESPSISERHCELEVDATARIRVRDLGSETGTLIDGEPVDEAQLPIGKTLVLGSVKIRQEIGATQTTAPDSVSPKRNQDRGVVALVNNLPQAFAYPVKSFSFTQILAIVLLIRLVGLGVGFVPVPIIGAYIGILFFGLLLVYVLSFFQQIVQSSAQGEQEMPPPPDIGFNQGDWLDSVIQNLGVVAISFGPALLANYLAPHFEGIPESLPTVFLLMGVFYFPGAYLLVCLYENLMGASPHAVFPIILVIGPSYLIVVALEVLILIGLYYLGNGLEKVIPFEWLSNILYELFFLYGMTVFMRMVGLMEWFNRERTKSLLP